MYKKDYKEKNLYTEIDHFFISRYPVISEIDYIINFNELEQFIEYQFS